MDPRLKELTAQPLPRQGAFQCKIYDFFSSSYEGVIEKIGGLHPTFRHGPTFSDK
jgi:hypothetical protein